jgi:hypothetical protein
MTYPCCIHCQHPPREGHLNACWVCDVEGRVEDEEE